VEVLKPGVFKPGGFNLRGSTPEILGLFRAISGQSSCFRGIGRKSKFAVPNQELRFRGEGMLKRTRQGTGLFDLISIAA
jgi:hypothetical protein